MAELDIVSQRERMPEAVTRVLRLLTRRGFRVREQAVRLPADGLRRGLELDFLFGFRRRTLVAEVRVARRASFWRGFPPMLASFCLRALLVQLDLTMIAGLGAGALAGYALVSRVAVLDAALTVAVGSVSLLVVSRAQTAGVKRKLLTEISLCAALLGCAAAAIGALAYPRLIDWLAHQDPAGEFARSAIFIYISATPIRMVESAAIFVLHSLGRSGLILGWQICETVVKAALNLSLISSFGFMGCFIASVIVEILSLVWLSSSSGALS